MYACLLFVSYSLPTIESNNVECTKEGDVFEYQEEEDQGHANQGKPSILDAYLILFTYLACFFKVYENACFYYCYYSEIAIVGDSAPRVIYYHPHGMTPLSIPIYPLDLVA
jgi:hypothetical protein